MAKVELRDVKFTYDLSEAPALDQVNLKLEAGKLYALIGANGSGKTTIANAIRGFIPHFYTGELQGEIEILGKSMQEYTIESLSDQVGLVFQNPFTQISGSKKTVFEEIAFGLENLGVARDEIIDRVHHMIKLAKLEELKDRDPMELSGGQQQRVALASVLVMDQDILVIDEPTSQLDPQSTDYIFEIINELKHQGKTILLIEHKLDNIIRVADYVYVLSAGKIVTEGTPRDVFTQDQLLSLGCDLPEVVKVARRMQQEGFEWSSLPITVEELCDQIEARRGELL